MTRIWPTRREILDRRGSKNNLDPYQAYAFIHEQEVAAAGQLRPVNTLFLTAAECPLACLFCDLWKNTLDHATPVGAVPAQIDHALHRLPAADWIKLYNSGNFFDPRSIPPDDWSSIAARIGSFERVIVENHAAMCDDRIGTFGRMLPGRLEIAVGLETTRADVLPYLNKKMTIEQFCRAAETIQKNEADLRVFVIAGPPGVSADEVIDTAVTDVEFAIAQGARHVSLVPGRAGNGVMEDLAVSKLFAPPRKAQLQRIMERLLPSQNAVITMDLWDWDRIPGCEACSEATRVALQQMNETQRLVSVERCDRCGSGANR